MKIVNRTQYETRDLAAILRRVGADTLRDDKRGVVVTVVYARKRNGASSGCASVGGTRCKIRIPKHNARNDAFAWVAVHEFRHLNGWTHAQMKGRYTFDDLAPYAWANDMPLGVRPPRRAVRPSAGVKLAHALTMQARAATRLKRAQTLARKWAQKVRYYERREQIAATSSAPSADGGQ